MSDHELTGATKETILEALATTRDAVAALAESIEGLASKEELEDVKDTQATKTRRLVIAVVALAVVLIAFLFAGVGIYNIAEQNRQTNRFLVDCTTPGPRSPSPADPTTGHPCYDDGQRRTGEAIGAIVAGISAKIDSALARAGIPPESPTTTTPEGG